MAEVLVARMALTSLADRRPPRTVTGVQDDCPGLTVGFLSSTEIEPVSAVAVLFRGVRPVCQLSFQDVKTKHGASMGVSMSWTCDARVLAQHGPTMVLSVPRSSLRVPQAHQISTTQGTLLLAGARMVDLHGTEVVLLPLGDEVDSDDARDIPPWKAHGYVTAC